MRMSDSAHVVTAELPAIQPERPYPFQGLIAIIVIERLFRSVVSQVPKCEKNVLALDSDLGHRGSVGELTSRRRPAPRRRLLNVVDHENIHRFCSWHQLQPKLLLKSLEDRRPTTRSVSVAVRSPVERVKISLVSQTRFVDNNPA
jgi:hypothetical protein